MSEQKQTYLRRSIANRAAKAEKLTAIADSPSTPWLVGKLAALASWRERPRDFELRMADRVDRLDAESLQRSQESREQLIAARGELQRIKAGEPRVVPQSNEVIGFANQQELAELDRQFTQPPQPPESPEHK